MPTKSKPVVNQITDSNQESPAPSKAASRTHSAKKKTQKDAQHDIIHHSLTANELILFEACRQGNIDSVYDQLWKGTDVNIRIPHTGNTPLSIACQHGYSQIVSLLIEFGAQIKVSNDYGVTPIHWASNYDDPKLINTLLEKGDLGMSELSLKDAFGSTPLHFASVRNKVGAVKLLLRAGSNPFLTNNDSRKPSEVTTDSEVRDILIDEENRITEQNQSMPRKATLKAKPKLPAKARRRASAPKKSTVDKSDSELSKSNERKKKNVVRGFIAAARKIK
ncbi:hypothetical protein HDV06_003168 [Boothiomyces sp. JEL0866]|nr:hypothetical protein HDV06_003168 [Boothiomyces sp. JEL0866]